MARTVVEIITFAQKQWCQPDEQVIMAAQTRGLVLCTLGTQWRAPHVPVGQVPPVDLPESPERRLHEVVVRGAFLGDEWVHDPHVFAWARGQAPQQAAIRMADLLAHGREETWQVLTTRRLAVVMESRFARPPQPQPAEGKSEAEQGKGGGLFGLARSLVREVRGVFGGEPALELTTLWEHPAARLRNIHLLQLGRTPQPREFVRLEFDDGSVLDYHSGTPGIGQEGVDYALRMLGRRS
ncbi:MAG TPA: hypothetical protein VIL00_18640 [Pseudonocardiaceae bacterium]